MFLPKAVWLYLGHACVVVGVAGVFLPVLPGAPILIVAAICYSKGSRRFFIKLVRHKKVGPPIRRWLRHRTIPNKAKAFAVGGMIVGASLSISMVSSLWVQLAIAALVLSGIVYVLMQPSDSPA